MSKQSTKAIKDHVLSQFGGPDAASKICGVTISAVSQWNVIPAVHQMKLYRYAAEHGMDFSAEDFHMVPKKKLSRVSCNNEILTKQIKNS